MNDNPLVSFAKKIGNMFRYLDEKISQSILQETPQYDSVVYSPDNSGLDVGRNVMDTVFVNDTSGSMGEKDCGTSRLDASKRAGREYVDLRAQISTEDRVALVSFDTCARVHLGLTQITEKKVFFNCLKQLRIGGATNIGEGLRAAQQLLMPDLITNQNPERIRRIMLLTDGHGGNAIRIANELKRFNVLIETIGIGGDPSAVDEDLLRKVATTDPDGFTHYWFISDSQQLINHYQQLATGIVWRGTSSDQK